MRTVFFAIMVAFAMPMAAAAAPLSERAGWVVIETAYDFSTLNARLDAAVKSANMALVTQASASAGAASQGFDIPGNRVVGVFRNDFARRMLAESLAAGIEAPIRFYVTEGDGGKSTLSYKMPSFVFEPYFSDGGTALADLGKELDAIFGAIAADATSSW